VAIQKDIKTRFGVVANYWRLIQLHMDWGNKNSRLLIFGYLDQDARMNNSAQIDEMNLTIAGDDFDSYFSAKAMNGISAADQGYDYLKDKCIDLQGGKDILEDGQVINEAKNVKAE